MKRYCDNCKKEFNADKSIRKYCSQRCYGEHKSKKLSGKRPKHMKGFEKGNVPANKGKKLPNNKECPQCGKGFRSRNIFCNKSCMYKSKDNPMKKIRKVRQDIRRLKKYRQWREEVIKRDGGKCFKCGTEESIEIDHFPRTLDSLVREYNVTQSRQANNIPEFWNIRNGRIMCRNCHAKEPTSTNTKVTIRNSSVCVTGGAGMIGSHLVDELLRRGNKVIVIDDLSVGLKKYVSDKAKLYKIDIRDDSKKLVKILKQNDVEYVFHLVSNPFIPECFENPVPFFQINAFGTLNLLVACEKANVKKILVYSSAEIYGTKKDPIKESDPVNPQSSYGAAKIAADTIAQVRFAEAGVPVVINRQFNVFSWRTRHPYVIPEIIEQLIESPKVNLGNIYAYRDFLFVEDAVNMAIELLEKGNLGEVYNLGAEKCIRIDELANRIGKVLGHNEIEINVDPKRLRPWDIARLQSDNTKLFNTIKYRPKYSLEEGLNKMIDAYIKNGKTWDY